MPTFSQHPVASRSTRCFCIFSEKPAETEIARQSAIQFFLRTRPVSPVWMEASVETLIIQAGNNCEKVSLLLRGLEARALGHYLSVEDARGLWIVETVNSGIDTVCEAPSVQSFCYFPRKAEDSPPVHTCTQARAHTHKVLLLRECRASCGWIFDLNLTIHCIAQYSKHILSYILGVEGRAIIDNMWKGIFSACISLKACCICG